MAFVTRIEIWRDEIWVFDLSVEELRHFVVAWFGFEMVFAWNDFSENWVSTAEGHQGRDAVKFVHARDLRYNF